MCLYFLNQSYACDMFGRNTIQYMWNYTDFNYLQYFTLVLLTLPNKWRRGKGKLLFLYDIHIRNTQVSTDNSSKSVICSM